MTPQEFLEDLALANTDSQRLITQVAGYQVQTYYFRRSRTSKCWWRDAPPTL